MPIRSFFILSCTLLLVVGCASYPTNPPLQQVDPAAGYRLQNHIKHPGSNDSVFVILAFSGGGTRAAAFS
jgi:NTE family protein